MFCSHFPHLHGGLQISLFLCFTDHFVYNNRLFSRHCPVHGAAVVVVVYSTVHRAVVVVVVVVHSPVHDAVVFYSPVFAILLTIPPVALLCRFNPDFPDRAGLLAS